MPTTDRFDVTLGRIVPVALCALVASALLAACGGPAAQPSAPAISQSDRAELIALGNVDLHADTVDAELARLRRIAELSARIGNNSVAANAAGELVDAARSNAAVARVVTPSTAAIAAADQLLAEAQVFAAELGRLIDDPYLVLRQAALDRTHGAIDDHLLWASRHVEHIRGKETYDAVYRLAAGDAALQASLEGRKSFSGGSALPLDQLTAVGVPALPALIARFDAAVESGEPDAVGIASRAIVAVDPWATRARIALMYLADVEAGYLVHTARLLRDVAGLDSAVNAFVRLERVRRTAPNATSVALGLAHRYMQARLHGDAAVLLRRLRGDRELDAAAAELLGDLEAAVWLDGGDLSAYRAWRQRRGAARSATVTSLEASYIDGGSPPAVRMFANESVRSAFADGLPALGWPDDSMRAFHVASDDEATRAVRVAAIDVLRTRYDSEATLAEHCLARAIVAVRCRALRSAAASLASEDTSGSDSIDALAMLSDVPLPASALEFISILSPADMRRVSPQLERFAGTGVEVTAEYAYARVLVDLANGDTALARTRLATLDNLMDPASRLAIELAVDDIASGRGTADEILPAILWPSWPPTIRSVPNDWYDESIAARTGSGYTDRMARAQLHMWSGDAAAAAADLAGLAASVDSEMMAGFAAYAAAEADDIGAAERFASQVRPAAPMRRLLDGHIALRAHDPSAAMESLGAAMAVGHRHSEGDRPFVRAVARADGSRDSVERLAAYFDVAGGDSWPWLSAALSRGHLTTGADVIAHLDAELDSTKATALTGTQIDWVVSEAYAVFAEQIRDAASSADARIIARKANAFIDGATTDWYGRRFARAWLDFLLGESTTAAIAMAEPERDGDLPFDSSNALVVLASERGKTIDDDLAWRVWRFYVLDDGDPSSIAQTLLDVVSNATVGAPVVCRLLIDVGLSDQAIDPCFRAWRAGSADLDLAAAVTWLMLNRPAEVRSLGVTPESLYAEASTRLRDATTDGMWLSNLSVWFEGEGDHVRASETITEAYARGYTDDGEYVPGWDLYYAQMPMRPTLLRYIANNGSTSSAAADRTWLAILALAGGEVEAASNYLAAAAARSLRDDESSYRTVYEKFTDIAAIARDDLAAGTNDADGVRWWMGNIDELTENNASDFAAMHPGSALAQLALLEAYTRPRKVEALALARDLSTRYPDSVVIMTHLIWLLDATGSTDEARAVYARAAEMYPDNETLAGVKPAARQAPTVAPATWARDVDRYNEKLAAVTEAQIAALDPVFVSDDDEASDAAFPAVYLQSDLFALGYTSPDATTTSVSADPRAAMCEAAACLDGYIAPIEAGGAQLVWRQQVELPSGIGGEALFALANGRLISLTVIPVGGRLYALVYSGAPKAFEAHIADAVLLRESFRPSDLVVPADRAQALRSYKIIASDVRLAARRELAASSSVTGCPIARALRSLDDESSRAALLLDAVLGGRADDIRRLLACAKPDAPVAARLAAIAVMHHDPVVHAFGVEATRAFPEQALTDGRIALAATTHGTVSARSRQDAAVAPPSFGWLELLGALPDDQRKLAADELFRSTDSNQRAIAILAAGLFDNAIDPELIRGEIRTAPARWAQVAVTALEDPGEDDLDAMRKRLDELAAPLDRDGRELAAAIAGALAEQVDPQDEARLHALGAIVSGEVATAGLSHSVAIGDRIEHYATVYDRARELEDSRAAKPDDQEVDALAWSWLSAKRQRSATARIISADQLATLPLARLLDGQAWSFSRLAQPGLFAATANGMYERLQAGTASDTFIARRVITAGVDALGVRILGESGGLDLSRPLECASPGDVASGGFVCTANVRDADAIRSALSARAPGRSSGIALPMQIAVGGTYMPMAAGFAPGILHSLLFAEKPSETDAPATSVIAQERARATGIVAGHHLERYVTATTTDTGGATVSTEYVLFTGDRVFVFSNRALALRVLSELPAEESALATSADFIELTATWSDGGSLQAVALGGSSALATTGHVAFEFALDSSGAALRMRAPGGKKHADVSAARSMLPDGAIATLASSISLGSAGDALDELNLAETDESGKPPPIWLLDGDAPMAFGWYLPKEFKLWERWVVVLTHGKATKKMLAAHLVPALAKGAVVAHEGLHYGLASGYVIIAPDAELVHTSAARTPAKAKRGTIETMSASLDGIELARALRMISLGFRPSDARTQQLAVFAKLVGAMASISVSATTDTRNKRDLVANRISPNLADEGVDLALVDQWLASPGIRNATKLPTRLTDEQLEAPIVLEVEVEDAKDAAERLFARMPRTTVAVIAADRLRLTISPGPKLEDAAEAAALSAEQRARLLASDAQIRSTNPKIKAIAAKLVPSGTDPKQAARLINEWVHDHITYEITPESLDAVQVLDLARGDCTEYSQLAVALLRAAGVPAEHRQGMAIGFGEMVAHNWVAFHDGTAWREIDPTWGRTWVDAGHMETSVTEFISLISLNQLAIVVAKPAE